jgi:4-hydroxy-tetrahydrodipicolinate synthase
MAREVSTFVISLTPFTEDGALDEAGLRAHLRRLADSGIGIYVGGSGSGEGYTLSPQERGRVLKIAREEVGKDTPLRAMGVEPRSAAEMIAYAELVTQAGLDAMQIYSLDEGHGNRPKDRELETFLRDVLEAVACPVVLSSHQSVGYALPRELVVELIESYDQIIGINFTHQDVGALLRMIEAVAGRIDIHVGGPMQAITALALGAQGYLSSEGNLAPKLCVRVIDHHRRGELADRDAAFKKVLQLFTEIQALGGIAATKGALRALGLAGGWPRRPRLPVDSAAGRQLAKCFEELSLREIEGLEA